MINKKIDLKISRTWSFNEKVAKVLDTHVKQSIPFYGEFHTFLAVGIIFWVFMLMVVRNIPLSIFKNAYI